MNLNEKLKKIEALFKRARTDGERQVAELAQIVGAWPMPRNQMVKNLWKYIKKHKRQDPKNKKNIIPDENLAKVFGEKKAIDMFEMTRVFT